MSTHDKPVSTPLTAEGRHAELWSQLTQRGSALIEAVARRTDTQPSRRRLLDYLDNEVIPHLRAEEEVLHTLARRAGERTVLAAMEIDHRALLRQVEHIDRAATPFDAALAARAVLLLFALRMEKEEKVLLPALARAGVDTAELLEGHHEMVGTPPST